MATTPQTPKTVAKQQFQDFAIDQLLYPKLDKSEALSRALKIFLISFGHYQQIVPQLYNQKLVEYMNEMQTLYGFQNIDQTMMEKELSELSSNKFEITIGIKSFRGRPLVTNPKIIIINGSKKSDRLPLNTNEVLQNDVQYSETMSFDDWKNYRNRMTEIVIKLEGSQWKMAWSELKQFSISYDQIHAEGYEDWFYFGRGVRLLIKINFKIFDQIRQRDRRFASDFHLQSIIYMLRERLKAYRSQPMVGPTHQRICRKVKVNYIRKRIERKTEQAFWSTPITTENILQRVQHSVDYEEDYSNLRPILRNDVKFNDLQIGFRFTDSFDHRVCLCSEWCNWNAFFHYNPIYRFLMVQNNQIFLDSRSNVADIYLFASTFCAYEAGLHLQPNQALPPTPILRLMSCSNDYRNLMHQYFYLKISRFNSEYDVSYPEPTLLNGLSYNLIRNEIKSPQLWLQSDVNPFSDVCIEIICDFYRLYSELHIWCSTKRSLVNQQDISKWFNELDETSRTKYKTYLKLSYDKRMANKLLTYDYLFTEDFEYSQLFDDPIQSIRNNILSLTQNQFNVKVLYNDFLSTFVSIHKFIQIVDKRLPSAKTFTSTTDLLQAYKALDRDFTTFSKSFEFSFAFDEQLIRKRNLEPMRKVLTVFFTLKHYLVAASIQSKCINSLIGVKLKVKQKPEQVSTQFNFIWNSIFIEQTLRKDFQNSSLFQINANIEQSFDEFYEKFWGKADHELNQSSQYAHNISSAYFQYQRLYFWWRNGGDTKFKFKTILDSLKAGLEDILRQSEDINHTYILPSIVKLNNYKYYPEVWDRLIQYLAKANCYMILSSIAVFLKKVHSLQMQSLVRKKICYSMCKPGWVPIFRTMTTCLQSVERIESIYIVFDDEFNRISTIFRETMRIIKQIYRNFYKKLVSDWLEEINKIGGLKNLYPNSEQFISVHVAVGHSFMSAFVDNFRKESRFYRKFLFSVLDYYSTDPHQQILNQLVTICNEYLTHPQEIQRAMPLLWPMWQNEIPSVDFNDLNQMSAKDVRIDLIAADS